MLACQPGSHASVPTVVAGYRCEADLRRLGPVGAGRPRKASLRFQPPGDGYPGSTSARNAPGRTVRVHQARAGALAARPPFGRWRSLRRCFGSLRARAGWPLAALRPCWPRPTSFGRSLAASARSGTRWPWRPSRSLSSLGFSRTGGRGPWWSRGPWRCSRTTGCTSRSLGGCWSLCGRGPWRPCGRAGWRLRGSCDRGRSGAGRRAQAPPPLLELLTSHTVLPRDLPRLLTCASHVGLLLP